MWEANHVWLVFDLIIFWTAFPHAFAAVMIAVALPLWLAAAGIVLRGSGFAFRKELSRLSLQRAAGTPGGPSPAGQNPVIRAGVVTLVVLAALVRRRGPR